MRRHSHPIVPLDALGIPAFVATTLTGGFLMRMSMRAVGFILPLLFQVGLGMSAFLSGLLVVGLNGGDLLLKTVVTRGLRIIGFWRVLVVGSLATTAALGSLVAFNAMTPLWLIFAAIFVVGMVRSFLFTGMLSLAFAETHERHMSGAVTLANMSQQLTGALGVSLSAVVMNFSAAARAGPGAPLALVDCRIALGAAALASLVAVVSFWRLPRDVGAEAAGRG